MPSWKPSTTPTSGGSSTSPSTVRAPPAAWIGVCVAALNGLISLIATAGVLAVLHPVLLPMLILIAAPRGWGAMRVAQERYVSVMSWLEHVRASRLIGNLLTERSAAQEVRLHAVGAFLLNRYERMAESAEAEQERLASSKALTEWLASALSGLAMAATYGAMFWLIMTGRMSLAIAGTAVIAVRTGSASLGALVMNINQLYEESLYVRDHGRFLAQAAQHTIPEGGDPVPEQVREIVLDRVTYRYPDRDTAALDQVSLSLPMGTVTTVVGENGSGKSTLMKILSGMLLPQAGTLRWGEADISDLDRSQVFERVCLLTQDFQRWPVTAAMNIRLGRPSHPATLQDLQPSVDYAAAGPVIAKLPTAFAVCWPACSAAPSNSPAANGRKWGLPAPTGAVQPRTRTAFSSWTNPPRPSTPKPKSKPSTAFAVSPPPTGPSSWSLTACPASATPTASTSSTQDTSSNTAPTTNSSPHTGGMPPCSTPRQPSTPPPPPSRNPPQPSQIPHSAARERWGPPTACPAAIEEIPAEGMRLS
ncbi:ATP-binding cassette domain-containing protein [Streptomyces sp. SLBN-115]|uniref:ATP-binding cassette domain-containing protein n=1 Tax=Streptomyces sp. SLBN-115 TaxID=2768453 RepID=UPI002E0FE3AF